MFESVSSDQAIRGDPKLRYELVLLSIAVHWAALAVSAAATSMLPKFPDRPPRLMQAFSIVDLKPELPPPPPAAPAAPRGDPRLPQASSLTIAPQLIVAPASIPDTIPEVKPMQYTAVEFAPAADSRGGDPEGSPLGEPGGVAQGEPGGKREGTFGGVVRDDGRVHLSRDVSLSMFRLNKEYPVYPERLRLRAIEDDVVLRYTIDKRGLVRDVTVLEHAARKEFDEAAVDAVRRWRFRPFVVDGEVREVVHDVLVSFRLE